MTLFPGAKQVLLTACAGIIVSLAAFGYLRQSENEAARDALQTEAFNLQREIRQNMTAHLFATELLAREWEQNQPSLEQSWQRDAELITLYYQSVQGLAWLSPTLQIQRFFPPSRQPQLLGTVFKDSDLVERLQMSSGNRHAMVGSAGNLGRLSSDVAMFARIENDDKQGFLGLIISMQDLLNNVIRGNISEGFQLSLNHQGKTLYQFAGDMSLRESWTETRQLQILGNSWQLNIWLTSNKLAQLRGGVSIAILLAGLLITAMLTFVIFILAQSRYKAQQLADANIELYTEIDERERIEKQMAYLAEHDALTNLINRNALMRILNEQLKNTELSANSAILFIDLDRFKEVNDALGHTVGDELLRRVARRISKLAPKNSRLARSGGDEFLLAILKPDNRQQVIDLTQQLLKALDSHFFVDDYELFISASIGIAFANDADFNAEYLIRNADTALYQAKDNGRNTYHLYNKAVHRDLAKKLELVKQLRYAVENESLVVYYQPKVELLSHRIVGLEALVRWVQEDGTVIGPDQFIPIAEDTGLIIPLSEFVLKEACNQLHHWHKAGFEDLTMAINISGKQLHLPHLVDDIMSTVHGAQVPADKIELELTEQVFIENIQSHTNFMHAVRDNGMSLAIDDFGVGYSSLSYLKNFPVTSLKIDRSFINDLPDNEDDAVIVQTIINLARNLNIQLVAEGIETSEQVDFLMSRECGVGQGYLFSRPLPAEKITELLENYHGLIPIQIA
ncbi:EAL domain-containing protein [Idiomarina sp.]|uniref:putative bifunctional diguanylate cyclase/phosphodiesterase n=1 Tax=Idiomarina sp. TaxID=1874361 RepID=UPI0025C47105|nr:EAL domain-containing protein [Idiomarina sp.]